MPGRTLKQTWFAKAMLWVPLTSSGLACLASLVWQTPSWAITRAFCTGNFAACISALLFAWITLHQTGALMMHRIVHRFYGGTLLRYAIMATAYLISTYYFKQLAFPFLFAYITAHTVITCFWVTRTKPLRCTRQWHD